MRPDDEPMGAAQHAAGMPAPAGGVSEPTAADAAEAAASLAEIGADLDGQNEVARMSSRFVGVHRSGKKCKPWTAACYWNGKQHHLGYYKTEEEAAGAYDAYVTEHALERRVNFPNEGAEDQLSAADAKASSKLARGVASRFAGVHHSRSNVVRPWRASCMSKRKYYHLGTYPTEEEAALAYDAFVIEHNLGRELNFPQYRHALQLGVSGAALGPGGPPQHHLSALAQTLGQQVAGGAGGAQQEARHDGGGLKPTGWQQHLHPLQQQQQPPPPHGAVAMVPVHPSFASVMGPPMMMGQQMGGAVPQGMQQGMQQSMPVGLGYQPQLGQQACGYVQGQPVRPYYLAVAQPMQPQQGCGAGPYPQFVGGAQHQVGMHWTQQYAQPHQQPPQQTTQQPGGHYVWMQQ